MLSANGVFPDGEWVAASHRFRVDLIKDGGKALAKWVSFGTMQIRKVRSTLDLTSLPDGAALFAELSTLHGRAVPDESAGGRAGPSRDREERQRWSRPSRGRPWRGQSFSTSPVAERT